MKISVCGIDPAMSNFGFAEATYDTETGVIDILNLSLSETKPASKAVAKVLRKNSDDLNRASELYESFQEICKRSVYAFIEVPVGSQSARAMASYGMCIGIIASCPIPYFQLNPTEVKLNATGSKFAEKREMIEWAVRTHPEANWLKRTVKGNVEFIAKNEHLADAVASIYAGINGKEFKQAVAMFSVMSKLET